MIFNNSSTQEGNKDSANNYYCYSTTEALTGEIVSRLCYVKENFRNESGREIIISKYYLRTWISLGLIYVSNPDHYFTINLSDLPLGLVEELGDIERDGEYIISQAITRIFERVKPKDYLPRITKDIVWKLEL
jgi:hypothetical protein